MNRRTAITLSAVGIAGTGLFFRAFASGTYDGANTPVAKKMNDLNLPKNPDTVEPLTLDKSEWQARLDADAFYVLREEGTERPFTSHLNDEKRSGEFACAGCNLVLFTHDQKFDSGTGWPSFFDAVEGRVETSTDYKLLLPRTEYHCARCGGHQGHVFKDGPNPTGLRYCNNGVALSFIPA